MQNKTIGIVALLGWGLFAISLMSQAPADETKGGGGTDGAGSSLTPNCPPDIAPPGGDGVVNVSDLLAVINGWGACPGGCATHGDCNDGNPCTQDLCVASQCQNNPIPNCCISDANCSPVPNATAGCAGNQCVILSCNPGFSDCNGLYADGCETSINSIQNCGGCGLQCSSPNPCMIPVCQSGICTLVPVAAGTACPGGVCDGAGTCVQF